MAHEIFERLPKGFRDLCEGVIIRVDDFPTDEVLDEMNAASEFDLLGLFQGIGLPFRSNDDIARLPNMVWLYRRPILDYWAEHDEALGQGSGGKLGGEVALEPGQRRLHAAAPAGSGPSTGEGMSSGRKP